MTKPLPALALLLVAVGPASAQEADPLAPEQNSEARAALRGWIFPGNDTAPVVIAITSQETPEPKSLAGTKDGLVNARPSYEQVAPGAQKIELKSGEEVLVAKTGSLRPERHYTAVAWNSGGKWELQVFGDDAASPNATDRPLRVMNFAGGRETLLAIDGGEEAKVAPDAVQEFRAPRKIAMVRVQVLALDGGPPAQSSVEVDFASSPSAYVVVGPDYRGRMRPRIIQGGAPPPEPAEPAGGTELQR